MIGLFRSRRQEPVEPLSPEALCARVGLPVDRLAKPGVPSSEHPEYLRVDGPRPTEKRSWRAGVAGPR